jgi:hypothetical protein
MATPSKGELRKARKAAKAAGQSWTVEVGPDGGFQQVQERTAAQERKHERAMERWGRRMDSDPDWR